MDKDNRRAAIRTMRGGSEWEAFKDELLTKRNSTEKELHKAIRSQDLEPINFAVYIRTLQAELDLIDKMIALVEG